MLIYDHPLFRPPSESRSLIFQITIGCSRNLCVFCGMYKGKKFRVRPIEEVSAEIDSIPAPLRASVDRVFLADGDALVYPYSGLLEILDHLSATFPNLARIGSYASPQSLSTKSPDELHALREKKLRVLYFGLESGDDETLFSVNKGFTTAEMEREAQKAREAGMKLSVTAILGLAGRDRSIEHARATAAWVNRVNPEFFSLLTLFHRHNKGFLKHLNQCNRGELLLEARELVAGLNPAKTILRSNHVSNFLLLSGSYPKDRERLIADVDTAISCARTVPGYLEGMPEYGEEYY
ncbi:MAG TPA: radical SAM protein [Geobacteraceae bacterium]|nr:radical SAM protein [Geobacteraceae bacterium]